MTNIAELLKDVPMGMKLYSPLFGEVMFKYITDSEFGIVVEDLKECYRSFDKYGRYFTKYNNAECLLFPSKDCRTWEVRKMPVEPKFKVGDSLQSGCMYAMVRRVDTENQRYVCQFDNVIPFEEQNLWNLIPKSKPHYDVSNFHEGMPVLVRDDNSDEWNYLFFSHYRKKFSDHFFAGGNPWCQCIPFDKETKHLLGTTDMCPEEYINW